MRSPFALLGLAAAAIGLGSYGGSRDNFLTGRSSDERGPGNDTSRLDRLPHADTPKPKGKRAQRRARGKAKGRK